MIDLSKERDQQEQVSAAGLTEKSNALLAVFDELTRVEQRAFIAWFAGGNSYVTKYGERKHVFFGKSECEQVDFEEFWLRKLPGIGWVEVEIERKFIAVGMVGEPNAVEYHLICTESGHDVRDAYWERVKSAGCD